MAKSTYSLDSVGRLTGGDLSYVTCNNGPTPGTSNSVNGFQGLNHRLTPL